MNKILRKELHQVLFNYYKNESYALTVRASMKPQVVTNANYLEVRGRLHYLLPAEELSKAVFDLTRLLSFSELQAPRNA